MSKEWFNTVYVCTKPFMLMIFLQTAYAVNGLVVKSALNKGLNHYTFAVYRNAIAALFFAPLAFFIERSISSSHMNHEYVVFVRIYVHLFNHFSCG